jgi:hypothetical protein
MGVHLLQVEEDIELAIQNRNREINPRDDHISFQVHSPSIAQIKIIMYLGHQICCLLLLLLGIQFLRFKQILLWMFTVFETRFVQWDPIQQIA